MTDFFEKKKPEDQQQKPDLTAEELKKKADDLELQLQQEREAKARQAGRAAKFQEKYKKLRDGKKEKGEEVDEDDPEIIEEDRAQKQMKDVVTQTIAEQKKSEAEQAWEKEAISEISVRSDDEEERKEILRIAKGMGIGNARVAVEAATAAYDRKLAVEQGGSAVPSFSHAGIYDAPSKNAKALMPSTVELGARFGHTEEDLKTKNKDQVDLRTWRRK